MPVYNAAAWPRRPKLSAEVQRVGESLVLNGHRFLARGTSLASLEAALARMDGETDVEDILGVGSGMSIDASESLLAALETLGLVDDVGPPPSRSGSDVILEVEELIEAHCATTIYQNPFWRACLAARAPGDLPQKLATGMVIENWHFLFRESYFDAPVLSYVPNTEVRLRLNSFFSEEYGHDNILLRSLNYVGLSREDMADAVPLPETMGLCNALAYWAHNDPIFFFATLGLLEGQGMKQDSFIDACERVGLPEPFIGPLRTHANINIGAGHGNLTRLIFQEIPALDASTVVRIKAQVPLFVSLYDDFYSGVWRYYTSDAPLLRRVSDT